MNKILEWIFGKNKLVVEINPDKKYIIFIEEPIELDALENIRNAFREFIKDNDNHILFINGLGVKFIKVEDKYEGNNL